MQKYSIQKKNSTALCQLSSWLTSVNIDNKPIFNENFDLIIMSPEKEEFFVTISCEDILPSLINKDIIVSASALTNREKEVAISSFHYITSNSGNGKPEPLNRGDEPQERLNCLDEFDLVAMRHREFRRSPNIPKEKFDQYKLCMIYSVKSFYSINSRLCKRHGIEIDDLMQYARLWVTNYCGKSEVFNPINNDNERRCRSYLRQRFSEFFKLLLKRERNCLPDMETVNISLFEDPNPNPLSLLEEDKKETTIKKNLNTYIKGFSHDKKIKVLTGILENKMGDANLHKEINYYLVNHRKSCDKCVISNTRYKKQPFSDQYGNVFQSVKEAAKSVDAPPTNITAVLRGRRKSCKGRIFAYINLEK